jgi:two-component system, response regulator PdtaR
MTEAEAFRWIQKSSMDRRMTMRAVAEEVLAAAAAAAAPAADASSPDAATTGAAPAAPAAPAAADKNDKAGADPA